jgi:hypothetical protein
MFCTIYAEIMKEVGDGLQIDLDSEQHVQGD